MALAALLLMAATPPAARQAPPAELRVPSAQEIGLAIEHYDNRIYATLAPPCHTFGPECILRLTAPDVRDVVCTAGPAPAVQCRFTAARPAADAECEGQFSETAQGWRFVLLQQPRSVVEDVEFYCR
jgi:hypothetical protein